MASPPRVATHGSLCEACGRKLRSADTVCDCTRRRVSAAAPDPAVGRYVCPGCGGRFGARQLRHRLASGNVPWYRPQALPQDCPHCAVALRERPYGRGWMLMFWLLWISSFIVSPQHWLPHPYGFGVRFGLAAVLLSGASVSGWRRWRDPQRYVLHLPARDTSASP